MDELMESVMESEVFYYGLICGVKLYQQKVITAHKRREFLKVGENLYYIQDGRERLEEVLDKICK